MLIKIKKVLVKAYNSIGLVEQYHVLLYCVYKILKKELKNKHINKEIILQIAVKTVNDSAGSDKIVLILLVFGLYLKMTEIDTLLLTIVKKAKAIRATTKKICQLYIRQQVNNAFIIRNRLNTIVIINLSLQSDVCV